MGSVVADLGQAQTEHSSTGCQKAEHVDPRVRRTRKLLQDAFRDLIKKMPYAEISVLHIAEQATVNRATFYAHYVDKQDLAVSIAKGDLASTVYGMFTYKPSVNKENFILFASAVFDFVGRTHKGGPRVAEDLQSVLAVAIQDELYALTLGWLEQDDVPAKVFRGACRETLASVISSSLYVAAVRWVRTGKREKSAALCEEIACVLMESS
jgi:AcrR family transcriptional regulator